MPVVKYRVPYQVDILGKDLSSGKRIGNTFYLKSLQATGAPPAYGGDIVGSSTATLLASFGTAWEALVLVVLSTKYKMVSYTMQAITGFGYQTPVLPIAALSASGVNATIQTPTPHGLVTSDLVALSGITTPVGLNGVHSVIVLGPTVFTVLSSATGAWTGPGSVQKTSGTMGLQYTDKEVLISTALGGVTGDALPIYADVDVRRLNAGTGKSFRSRFAMAPIGESDNDFGKLNAAAITAWAGALTTFNANFSNGGADATAGSSASVALSRKLATLQGTPFTSSDTFTRFVQSYAGHANLGTQLQRKVKLAGS